MDRWSIVPNRFAAAARLLFAGLALTCPLPPAPQQNPLLPIPARKLLTIPGVELTNGIVVVGAGKITAVGANLPIPEGAKVLEAAVVMPGLVEAHGARGMDAPNENVPVVPFVNTADGVDPVNVSFE